MHDEDSAVGKDDFVGDLKVMEVTGSKWGTGGAAKDWFIIQPVKVPG
jgi:hypothetical protein